MKIIKFRPKITQARTVYVSISNQDFVYLLEHLVFMKTIIDQIDKYSSEYPMLHRELHRSRTLLPRRTQPTPGLNSYASFVSGLIENFGDTQRDFSVKTLPGLESTFAFFADEFHTFQPIKFEDASTVNTVSGYQHRHQQEK